MFKFPSKDKKPQKYQSWVKAISMYQRKGGGDTFHPSSKNTVICEHHFKEEHLKKAAGSTRKTYREDAVPLIFKFKSLTRPSWETNIEATSSKAATCSELYWVRLLWCMSYKLHCRIIISWKSHPNRSSSKLSWERA